MPPPTALVLVACAASGLAVGYALTARAPMPTQASDATAPIPIIRQLAPPPAAPASKFEEVSRAIEEIAAAQLSELPGILDAVLGYKSEKRWDDYFFQIGAVAERWAALDPIGGARHAEAIDEGWFAQDIFAHWARRDPDAALESAAGQPALRSAVLSVLARTDPARFRTVVLEFSPDQRLDHTATEEALQNLAATDLDAALELFDALPDDNKHSAAAVIAEAMARGNPDAAIEWALARESPVGRKQALEKIALVVARTDLAAAAALFAHFRDPSDFPAYEIAKLISETDRDRAFEWLLAIDSDQGRRDFARLFVHDLAPTDPHTALANLLRSVDTIDDNSGGLSRIAFRDFDPAVLPELAAELDSATNRIVLGGIAGAWFEDDADAALDWAAAIATDGADAATRKEIALSIGLTLTPNSFDLSGLPALAPSLAAFSAKLDPETSDFFAAWLAHPFGRTDDPALADFFLNRIARDTPSRQAFIKEKFGRLADADPEGAIAQIPSLGDPALRAAAAGVTALKWARYDGTGASAWAASLPPGHERDRVADSLGSAFIREDPAAALAWIASISDPELLATSAARTMRYVSTDDLARATDAALALDIDDAAKAVIVSAIRYRSDQLNQ